MDTNRRQKKAAVLKQKAWLAWAVLLGGLVISGLATWYVKTMADAAAEREFVFACNEIRDKIADRLDDSTTFLRSGAALFEAAEDVTRSEWRAFAKILSVDPKLAGLMGIGFGEMVPAHDLARHVSRVRGEGFADYRVWPEGRRNYYSPVTFLEPFSGRNLRAFGYDMASEPVRRAALEQARDENVPTLSGKVVLVQETEKGKQAGTLMYFPVYRRGMPTETVAQRRAALRGWVYSPYRMSDLMSGILGGWDQLKEKRIRLEVYDGDRLEAKALLYDSQDNASFNSNPMSTEFIQQERLNFSGSHWTLRLSRSGNSLFSERYIPVWFTCAGGLTITVLLFGLILSLLNTRARARQLADELTQELREKETFTRDIVNSLAANIAVLAPDGTIVEVNAPWQQFAMENGASDNEDYLGVSYLDICRSAMTDEPLAGQALVGIQAVLKGRQPEFTLEYPCHSPDKMRWFLMRVTPLSGGRAGAVVSHAVITQRVLAQESLRHSEEQFRLLFENSGDGIFLTYPDGRIIAANPAACRIFGMSEEELRASGRDGLIDRSDDRLPAAIAARERSGQFIGELRFIRKDGTVFTADVTSSMFQDSSGNVRSAVLLRDVTQRKEMEEALVQSKQVAEEASQAKSRFLAIMSHEIRTPMNGIIGMTGLLLDTPLNQTQREYVDIVRLSSENLLHLLNDILDISRIEAGKVELLEENFDVREAARTVIDSMTAQAKQKGLALGLHLDTGLPRRLYGDLGRIRQIIINLISNGIKFTAKGAVDLHVDLLPEQEEKIWLRFTVSDTGIGIPADRLTAIFEPFTQVDGTVTRRYGGSGLGLAICHQLVSLMGGAIDVQSREGDGSIFRFTLPLQAAQPAADKEPTSTPIAAPLPAGQLRVLVAEDDPVSQAVVTMHLINLGCRVDLAANGSEALRAAEQQDFDLIIMDCQMPEMSGIDVTRVLRDRTSQARNHDLPIIALTADALSGDRERCLAAGMNDYLTKPLDVAALKSVLERWAPPGAIRPVFDAAGSLKRHHGDRNFIEELAVLFLETAQAYLRAVDESIAASETDTTCRNAHALKGASATFGAERLCAVASEMEKVCHRGDLHAARKLAERLAVEFDRLKAILLEQGWTSPPN